MHHQNSNGIFFFYRNRKKILNSSGITEDRIVKVVTRKKSKAGSIIFLDFKIFGKSTTIKFIMYWQKNRLTD